MTDTLTLVVLGEPVPKGRARSRAVTTKGGKSFVQTYTPKETRAYEDKVKVTCLAAVNMSRWTWTKKDRFRLTVHVYREHEGAGGDLDNYAKAILDGINKVAFADDRYVRRIVASLFVDKARPRVEVAVVKLKAEAA